MERTEGKRQKEGYTSRSAVETSMIGKLGVLIKGWITKSERERLIRLVAGCVDVHAP